MKNGNAGSRGEMRFVVSCSNVATSCAILELLPEVLFIWYKFRVWRYLAFILLHPAYHFSDWAQSHYVPRAPNSREPKLAAS